MPYYAVARGRVPGIFKTWPECEKQVKGFTNARYKKFNTESEAKSFISANQGIKGIPANLSSSAPSNPLPSSLVPKTTAVGGVKRKTDGLTSFTAKRLKTGKSTTQLGAPPSDKVQRLQEFGEHSFPIDADGFVHVYTDGSCEGNGQKVACAGLGVFFMEGHALNTAKPVKGRATNNCGEIQAATLALRLAKSSGITKLQINTDSNYLIRAVNEWMPGWKRKGWVSFAGKDLKNQEDFQELDKELTKDIEVRWHHVRGHQGIYGNEKADALARHGSEMYRQGQRS